jgi:hypothetical protein
MKMKLTDANGKVFETSLSQIQDMTFEVESFQKVDDKETDKEPIFQVSIKDSEGNEIKTKPSEILDAAKKDPAKVPSMIDVTFEATHSGTNRNFAHYHSDSMEKDAESWMTPFPKPMIKNHDDEQEPLGRVVNYEFKKSALAPERDCISVTWRISDADAIMKFLDGRYYTMSIGATGKRITCDFCGQDILKDGEVNFCGHWRGETYTRKTKDSEGKDVEEKEVCFWSVRDMEYKEGSVVNRPADDFAQKTGTEVVADSEKKEDEEAKTEDSAMDTLDKLAAEGEEKKEPNAEQTDSKKDEPEQKEEVSDEVKELLAKIAVQDEELNKAKDEIKSLKTQLKEANLTKDSLKEELKIADEEAKNNRKQGIQMALMNKELLAQRIVDNRIFLGETSINDKEKQVAELKVKPVKDLNDSLNSILEKKEKRKPAKVENQGLANPTDKHSITEDSSNEEDQKKEPTMADFQETLVDLMTSNNNSLQSMKKEEF